MARELRRLGRGLQPSPLTPSGAAHPDGRLIPASTSRRERLWGAHFIYLSLLIRAVLFLQSRKGPPPPRWPLCTRKTHVRSKVWRCRHCAVATVSTQVPVHTGGACSSVETESCVFPHTWQFRGQNSECSLPFKSHFLLDWFLKIRVLY